MGKKPYTRICDRCGHRKPWRQGYHPPGDPPRFVCADCCQAAGGVHTPRNGWQFPLPSSSLTTDD